MDLKHNRTRKYKGTWVSKGDPVDNCTDEQANRMVACGQAYWEASKPKEEIDPELHYEDYPYHIGGGWYKLSNETTVKGREEAEQQESEL